MKWWLIPDTHFFHEQLVEIGVRPEFCDSAIRKNWEQMVAPEDVIVHLGDIVLGTQEQERQAHELIRQLPGRKWLTLGNHDHKNIGWYLEHGWDAVARSFAVELFGERLVLSHTPILWDGWYTVNIHGHLHNFGHREQEFQTILTDRHELMALETTHWRPALISTVLEARRKRMRKQDEKRCTLERQPPSATAGADEGG